jgi:dTDP-4-dehydrorhamnose reductase
MRILITGASGLLGINLALELAQRHIVFGIVHEHRLDPAALPFRVLQCDLLEKGAIEWVMEASQPDWIIHCAALANVDACEAEPGRAAQLNTELPRRLASYVARGGARKERIRLVHISTDAVFDGQAGQYTEEDLPNPLGIYAKTKLAGENSVFGANPDALVARVNLFGWGITGKRSLAEFFFYNLQSGRKVMGFTDVSFCPMLANDMAGVLEKMLEKNLKGLFHVVGSECLSKFEFGLRIAQRFGLDAGLIRPISVQQSGLLAMRSPNLSLRIDKLSRALGEKLPGVSGGIDRLFMLYEQGYPQRLKQLGKNVTA